LEHREQYIILKGAGLRDAASYQTKETPVTLEWCHQVITAPSLLESKVVFVLSSPRKTFFIHR
jgi:hypothetical protein